MSSRFRPSRYGRLQEFLVEEHFSVHYLADRLREQGRGVVLHKNPGNTGADQLGCLALVDDCSHHQDLAAKALSLRGTQELRSVTFSKIKIKQHDINLLFLQNPKSFLA